MNRASPGGRCVVVVVVASVVLPRAATAQATDPYDVAAQVAATGSLSAWVEDVALPGCPPDDPRAQALVEAFTGQDLTDNALRPRIASLWRHEIGACGYAPLEDWYYQALADAAGMDLLEAFWLLEALPPHVPERWAETLWGLAVDTAVPQDFRTSLAVRMTDSLSAAERLGVLTERAGTPGIPLGWVGWQAHLLLKQQGLSFLDDAVGLVEQLDDLAAGAILGPVYAAVRLGEIALEDPRLVPIQSALDGRPALGFVLAGLGGPLPEIDPPSALAGGPYFGQEGEVLELSGTDSTDPLEEGLTYSWDLGDGDESTGAVAVHVYRDDGDYAATLVVLDILHFADTAVASVRIINEPPRLDLLEGPAGPVPVGSDVALHGTFSDPGVEDSHTALIDWKDGSSTAGSVLSGGGAGSLEGVHQYREAGVYSPGLVVTDDDGGSTSGEFPYVVVYDPSGGFVTGGGWVDSPPGAYGPDPSASGRANFGFVSRYQRDAQTPDGETQFRMQAVDLDFHSTAYEWLVVTGARAQYKGTGRLNGVGGYGFMLHTVDGTTAGGGGVDRLRIKVWSLATGEVVYDNQRGDADDIEPKTALGGGQIRVHR